MPLSLSSPFPSFLPTFTFSRESSLGSHGGQSFLSVTLSESWGLAMFCSTSAKFSPGERCGPRGHCFPSPIFLSPSLKLKLWLNS
jgi:hypothetical protein